jgi:hypothetical protein
MTNEQTSKKLNEVVFGCYGNRRSIILAAFVSSYLARAVPKYEDKVKITFGGLQKFMEGKQDHPIEDKHYKALEQVCTSIIEQAKEKEEGKGLEFLTDSLEFLSNKGRKVLSSEQLKEADYVLSVDAFVRGEHQKLAGEENEAKYMTVLQFLGKTNLHYKGTKHEKDLDDTETSIDFTERVIIPKLMKEGKIPKPKEGPTPEPANIKPCEALYYSLQNEEFIAGDSKAAIAEARDLIVLSAEIGEAIIERYKLRNEGK